MSDPLDFAIDNARFALKVAEAYLKSHKADYAEIKTEGYYNRVLNHNVLLLYNGEMSESEFVDDLARLIEQQFTRAWREGAREVGFDPDQMTEAQQGALEERILQEYDYVDNYASQITEAARNGDDVRPYQDRVDMWANRYNEVRDQAKIEFSKGTGQLFEWVLGPTEQHCDTCGGLSGIVATADEWDASGYKPQSRELACHGYNCQCEFQPTDKPKTEGGIPALKSLKYSDDQPRDERGRWTDGGGGYYDNFDEYTYADIYENSKYISSRRDDWLITVSPSNEADRPGWKRINYWSRSGIEYHEEFSPDKFEKEFRDAANPRGGVKIRLESPNGNYPNKDEFVNRGFWGRASGVNGSRAFVGLPKDIPSVAGRLRAAGYKLTFGKVTETAPKPTVSAIKYNPDQPRVPSGNPNGGQWLDDNFLEDNPYGNSSVLIGGSIDRVLNVLRNRLMPPQFDELINSINGNTTVSTRNYWADHLLNWADLLYEDGEISENEYNDIINQLGREKL